MRKILLSLLLIPSLAFANNPQPKEQVKSQVVLLYCGIAFAEFNGSFRVISESLRVLPGAEGAVNAINETGLNLRFEVSSVFGGKCGKES